MYLGKGHSYYRNGEQYHSKAPFLILVQAPYVLHKAGDPPRPSMLDTTRAIVRDVALHQCGHFMMGSARAWGHRIPISGAYGSDGNPREVPQEVYDRAIPVPREIMDAWNTGNGWNGTGSEAPSMHRWALDNMDKLQSASKRKGRR